MLGGVAGVSHITVMNRLNKTEFAIYSSLMWSLLPKDLTNQNIFPFLDGDVPRSTSYGDYIF